MDATCTLCPRASDCPFDGDEHACQARIDDNWVGYPEWRRAQHDLYHDLAVARQAEPPSRR